MVLAAHPPSCHPWRVFALQKTVDLATDFSDGFYPLQFNDGLATATNLATDLPTDNIPSPK